MAQESQLPCCVGFWERTLGLCSLRTKAETRGALPEKVFNSEQVVFGAGEKFFERCLSGKPSWPSPKAEDTFFAGEYDNLFLSRVVQPG